MIFKLGSQFSFFMREFLKQPNMAPVALRTISFPVQFAISLLIWKTIYLNSNHATIQSLLMMTSISFLSTILLYGGHTNLTNQVIDKADFAKEEFSFLMIAPFASLLLLSPVIILFQRQISVFLFINQSRIPVLAFLFISIAILAPSAAFQSILIGNHKNSLVSLTPLLGAIFSLVICIASERFLKLNIFLLYLLIISAPIFSTLFLGIFAFRYLSMKRISLKFENLKLYLNFGSFLISISAPLAFQMDRILITHLGTSEDSLKCAPVNRIVSSVLLILSSSALSFWPHLRKRDSNQLIQKYILNSFLVAIAFGMCVFVLSSTIVDYVTNGLVSLSLGDRLSIVLYLIVYSSVSVSIILLSDSNGQLKVFFYMCVSTLVTVLLSIILIPRFGLVGYYLSASISVFFILSVPLYRISMKTALGQNRGRYLS